jgi:hypothetical protein
MGIPAKHKTVAQTWSISAQDSIIRRTGDSCQGIRGVGIIIGHYHLIAGTTLTGILLITLTPQDIAVLVQEVLMVSTIAY